MASSGLVEGVDGSQENTTNGVGTPQSSIMSRQRAAKMPSSFSSNLGNRNSPTSSRSSRHQVPQECKGNGTNGGRSVKSIVGWIEASNPVTPASPKKGLSKVNQNLSNNAARTAREHLLTKNTIPHAPGVEDHSLTFLNYSNFFTETPLGRCLDGVTEDLSKTHLESIFSNAGRGLPFEETRVSLLGSAHSMGEGSSTAMDDTEAEIEESGAAAKVVEIHGQANFPVDLEEMYAETLSRQEVTTASVEHAPTSMADGTPQCRRQGLHEVNKFWNRVRSKLHISDDELEDDSAASESHKQTVGFHAIPSPRFSRSSQQSFPTSKEAKLDPSAMPSVPTAQQEHGPGDEEDKSTPCKTTLLK